MEEFFRDIIKSELSTMASTSDYGRKVPFSDVVIDKDNIDTLPSEIKQLFSLGLDDWPIDDVIRAVLKPKPKHLLEVDYDILDIGGNNNEL